MNPPAIRPNAVVTAGAEDERRCPLGLRVRRFWAPINFPLFRGLGETELLIQPVDELSPGISTTPASASVPGKPLLFLHIPKTAGGSFLLMLQNVFGDARVRRVVTIDGESPAVIDEMVANELDSFSVLTGHLPLWLFNGRLDRFAPFTMLRDPTARVLSLFRFLRASGADNLARLGLRPDVTLGEFLDSRHPENFSQIHNGMVRMLSGDVRMDDPENPAFWNPGAAGPALDLALANLERFEFGLTEQTGETLKLLRANWSAPYELRECAENVTDAPDAVISTHDLRKIEAMNALDLILYRRAQSIFATRLSALHEAANFRTPTSERMVFAAPLGRSVGVAEIAGRQGFHEFENEGFAWLDSDRPAEINFTIPVRRARVQLLVYCVTPDYPADDIVVRVNGRPVRVGVTFPSLDPGWRTLETEAFEASAGVNRLQIEAPLFVPAASLHPGSKDRRRLGIALCNVELNAHPVRIKNHRK